jgi:type VI secretion system secreted protein Hcp
MAFDAFLKIDGIDGESQDAKHKSEIQVLSWSFGDSNTQAPTTRGAAAGRSQLDFSFVKVVDKASPLLMQRTCAGQSIPSATLTVRRQVSTDEPPVEFLKVTMSEVIITSLLQGGNCQTDGSPLDQVSFSFLKLTMAVTPESGDPVTASCGSSVRGG